MFPKIGVFQNAWLIMENSTRMDDLGVPLFFGNTHIWYIYLHCPDFHMVNVGKYTSPHRSCGNGTMTMTMTISDPRRLSVAFRSSMSNMVQEFFGEMW